MGGDDAVLDLTRAMAMVRPQAPSWSFAMAPLALKGGSSGSTREGDMLTLEVAVTLVKRRTPGGWHNLSLALAERVTVGVVPSSLV